jgi:hypothetical protein
MDKLIKKLLKEGLMSEKSIDGVTLDDFNTKEIINNWLMSSNETPVTMYKYEMQDDYQMDDEEKEELLNADIDDVAETDAFKKWLNYEVGYKIEDSIDTIKHYIKDDTITVWRKMTVKMEWIKALQTTGQRLGKFWSFEEDAAEAHWGGHGEHTVSIQTTIPEEYIDWNQTIEANIDPQLGEDEKEITLFKNTPIKIEALWVDGKSVDINPIKHKMFKV